MPTIHADTGAAMPAEGLRERKKRVLRSRLVEIAGEHFSLRGYGATNMREIADEAEVAYQTLYNHYPNKARLGMAWMQARTEEIQARSEDALSSLPDDPVQALVAGAVVYLDLLEHIDPELWRDVIAEYIRTPEAFDDATQVFMEDARHRTTRILDVWKDAGRLRPDTDTRVLGQVLFVLADHTLLRYAGAGSLLDGQLEQELKEQIELVITPWLP